MKHEVQAVALLQYFFRNILGRRSCIKYCGKHDSKIAIKEVQGQLANNENVRVAYRRYDSSFSGYHICSF
jgi:hypothetical protein